MWLVGVVVRRYIDFLIIIITYPYSTCISSFLQQHPYFLVHFLIKRFFVLAHVIFVQYSKRCSKKIKNIRDCSKIEIMPT